MADKIEFYTESQRELQTQHDTIGLADALASAAVSHELSDQHRQFIESRDFFFLSTVNGEGEPTVSYKGGAVGFVRTLDANRLLFPSYDGNGMFLSVGNMVETSKVGLLFIDFETPNRLRVQGTARVLDQGVDRSPFPGADLIVEVQVTSAFVNCARYIHKHTRMEDSRYIPDDRGTQPLPSWKRIDGFQDVLPSGESERVAATGGTIDEGEYRRLLQEGKS